MDRCAMFVDAGYVHKMSDFALGEGHNSRHEMKPEGLVATLTDLAQQLTGLPLLRIYWYDAANGRVPTPAHKALARQGAMKIRIGSLKVRADGSVVQKGVDAEIHADMVELARNGAVCDMVLLSGDEDLLRAVDEVQACGVRVHLWGIDAAGTPNQSAELIMASDVRHILAEDWVRDVHGVTATEPAGVKATEPAEPEPQTVVASAPAAIPIPSPGTLPSRMTTVMVNASVTRQQQEFAPLSELSTTPERTLDDQQDDGCEFTAQLAGHRYGRRWLERADVSAVHRLRDRYPSIPRSIDGELLRYAESKGVDTWSVDETEKYNVRKGFWSAIKGQ